MPRKHQPGWVKPADRQRIAETMCYPGNYDCRDILEYVCRKKERNTGASRQYPSDFVFALGHCERILRSAEGLAKALAHDDDLYQACRNAYIDLTGRSVPRNPPSVDQIDHPAECLAKG